jgi:predicted component of type VI protein secretion system
MSAQAQGNVVTLSLSQGESPNPTATFTSAMAARQVILGSGPSAHWKVRGHGVEASHLELYWDGKVLWVRDGGSLSGVYVGVDRAEDWAQVFDGTEVYFGQAVIRATVTGPDAREKSATGPINPKAAAFIDEEESTMVFSAEGFAAALRSEPPPAQAYAPAPQRSSMSATGQLPALPGRPVTQAPKPAPEPAPMRGVMPDLGLPPASSEATVIRASPYAAMEAAGLLNNPSPALTPLAGTSPARVSAPSAPMVQQPSVHLPSAPRPGTMAPPMAPGFVPGGFGPLVGPGPSSAPPPGMMNGAAGPAAAFDDPFGPMEMPPAPPAAKSSATPGPGGVPVRTWLLAALTLGVAALGLTFNNAPRPAAANSGRRVVRQIVRTTAAPAPTSNNLLGLPTGPNQLLGVIVPAPIAAPAGANGQPRFPPPNPQDPIKLAADMVAAHRYEAAAALYEGLAAQHREAPLFRHFALVLRARAAHPTCTPGAAGCPPRAPASP